MRNPLAALLGAALLLLPAAAGCAKDRGRARPLLRLFAAGRCTLAGPDGERAAPPPAMRDVAGEARPALELASGVVARCETTLPDEPCWLDVAAARLYAGPSALSGEPLLLDVTLVAGADRTTLLHALPSPGTKPTALGWARARVEVTNHLGEDVRLEFRLELPPDDGPPPTPASFALAEPRLAPRVDAGARPWNLVDWLSPGPPADELTRADAAKRWPGFAWLLAATARDEVVTATPPRSARRAASSFAGARASDLELELFGCEQQEDDGEVARRACDRFARVDPFLPFALAPDDPALAALERLAPPLRADRARALGERSCQLELARPRRAPLCVEITSARPTAECDAALQRLLEFLAANELLDRTILLVRALPPAGAAPSRALAIARLPRGWRERAPAELIDRFDARAPEFAGR